MKTWRSQPEKLLFGIGVHAVVEEKDATLQLYIKHAFESLS